MRHEAGRVGDMAVESLTGRLLVATPSLKDPNFERTVVLLLAHERGGALGVVLNRATELPVTDIDALGPWAAKASEPGVVFEGGPVQPEAAICLARVRPGGEVRGITRVAGPVCSVNLPADPEQVNESIEGVRVFSGYAGWEAGQLETEIDSGSWLVFDGLPGDAFFPRPDDLWPMVLRRQGGLLSAVALFPSDPSLN